MEFPLTRMMLQTHREAHLKHELKSLIKHWVKRIYGAVQQQAKLSDERCYVFTDISESTDPFSLPYSCCIPECHVEAILVELKKVFPDSDIQYSTRKITIDWS